LITDILISVHVLIVVFIKSTKVPILIQMIIFQVLAEITKTITIVDPILITVTIIVVAIDIAAIIIDAVDIVADIIGGIFDGLLIIVVIDNLLIVGVIDDLLIDLTIRSIAIQVHNKLNIGVLTIWILYIHF